MREQKSDTLLAALVNGIRSPLNNLRRIRNLAKLNDEDNSIFWALRDVSFDVQEGEVLGIIGHNGAGKSTLLKILSRITEPSTGEVHIHGRIAALLEVGTGFHPELTGRENIYMNGTILGMRKKEIDQKLDEIVDFSGVEKHLDTPVKFYSSGMRVRLGFSVAAHLEPEILIIDEVLSVGDAEFQKKCLGKMESVAGQGRTVLFVSHNMVAVSSLCGKGVLLKGGQKIAEGFAPDVIGIYQKTSPGALVTSKRWDLEDAPGNDLIKVADISASPLKGSILNIDSGVMIQFLIYSAVENKSLDTTLELITKDEIVVFHKGIVLTSERNAEKGFYFISVEIPPFLLNANVYRVRLIIGESQRYLLFQIPDVLTFEIENSSTGMGSNLSSVPGVVRPNLEWKVEFNRNRQ